MQLEPICTSLVKSLGCKGEASDDVLDFLSGGRSRLSESHAAQRAGLDVRRRNGLLVDVLASLSAGVGDLTDLAKGRRCSVRCHNLSVGIAAQAYHNIFAIWSFSSLHNRLEGLGRVPIADGIHASVVDSLCRHNRMSITGFKQRLNSITAYQGSEHRKASYQGRCNRCHPVDDDCMLSAVADRCASDTPCPIPHTYKFQ